MEVAVLSTTEGVYLIICGE